MYVLIVDDDERNRYLLRTQLSAAGMQVAEAAEGEQALLLARKRHPDVVVSDILMPGMDGFALCREWKADPALSQVPFCFYTANYTESGDRDLALTLGADLFLTKPMSHTDLVSALTEVVDRVRREGHTRSPLDIPAEESFREHNVRLLHKMEQQLAELTAANERLHDMVVNTVLAIATLVEARDPYTAGHQERVALLAYTIADAMDVPDDECDGIRLAGLVHDIGKIYVPLEILSRPSELTAPEFEIIKMHPTVAYNALKGIDFPWPLAEWVRQHHERMDGSGYPQGLRGDQVLAGARILVVADVVEAMTNHRPYKPAVGIEAALAEIREGAGRLYDTAVAETCLALFDQGFTLPAAPAHQGAASL